MILIQQSFFRSYPQDGILASVFGWRNTAGSAPPPPPVISTTTVGGSGKDRRNEIIEIEGVRFSVPKDRVEEFLARFDRNSASTGTTQQAGSVPFFNPDLKETVSFSTPKGLTVTTTRQDDMGLILLIAALADEDFYEE